MAVIVISLIILLLLLYFAIKLRIFLNYSSKVVIEGIEEALSKLAG